MSWVTKRSGTQLGTAAEYVVMPEALRRAAASLKGHAFIPDSGVTKVLAEEAFPITAAIVLEARQREVALIKAEQEALKLPRAGQLFMSKGGIYLGAYVPKDRDGKSIGKIYCAFAAPEDMKDAAGNKLVLTFKNMAKEVGNLRNWNGHDGLYLENDTALDKSLKNDSYKGQWIMPPSELLYGKDVDRKPVAVENLLSSKDAGAFAGTFTMTDDSPGVFPGWYWSLTELREYRDYVWSVRLSSGYGELTHKTSNRLACRPIRLE